MDQAPRDPLPPYRRPQMPFEREPDTLVRSGGMAAAGFEFGAVVTVFFLGGLFLDGKLGTDPWLSAIGALVGVALGMFLLIRRVTRTTGPAPRGEPKDGGSGGPDA